MHPSIGIDIVEWKKAETFYRTHRKRLGSFLSASEKRFVKNGYKPHRALAMIFAAKEAAFKAIGAPWMGPEGFRRIKIHSLSSGMFSFLAPHGRKLKVTFRISRRHVVACCTPF